ncbi:winged helix-turn-helix domain-containing protein [Rhizobium sp. SL42]|uniref:winged helix-turn-helix domain-containing protein n=1 Tax=Rhizobium sp. SL42 TaxID=2806346 RepID=UPI003FA73238|nr:winged helix-turn-helix domain-containing protein [Rhizobium sp. SL42]
MCDLAQWLWEEFRASVSEQTLNREVRAMGYRRLAARPKHCAQASTPKKIISTVNNLGDRGLLRATRRGCTFRLERSRTQSYHLASYRTPKRCRYWVGVRLVTRRNTRRKAVTSE